MPTLADQRYADELISAVDPDNALSPVELASMVTSQLRKRGVANPIAEGQLILDAAQKRAGVQNTTRAPRQGLTLRRALAHPLSAPLEAIGSLADGGMYESAGAGALTGYGAVAKAFGGTEWGNRALDDASAGMESAAGNANFAGRALTGAANAAGTAVALAPAVIPAAYGGAAAAGALGAKTLVTAGAATALGAAPINAAGALSTERRMELEGIPKSERVLAAATGFATNTAVSAVPIGAGRILVPGFLRQAAANAAAKASPGLAGRVARTAVEEGVQEGVQSGLETAVQQAIVTDQKYDFNPGEIGMSALEGAAAGVLMGAGGGAVQHAAAHSPLPTARAGRAEGAAARAEADRLLAEQDATQAAEDAKTAPDAYGLPPLPPEAQHLREVAATVPDAYGLPVVSPVDSPLMRGVAAETSRQEAATREQHQGLLTENTRQEAATREQHQGLLTEKTQQEQQAEADDVALRAAIAEQAAPALPPPPVAERLPEAKPVVSGETPVQPTQTPVPPPVRTPREIAAASARRAIRDTVDKHMETEGVDPTSEMGKEALAKADEQAQAFDDSIVDVTVRTAPTRGKRVDQQTQGVWVKEKNAYLVTDPAGNYWAAPASDTSTKGVYKLDPSSSTLRPLDANGNPTSNPVILDRNMPAYEHVQAAARGKVGGLPAGEIPVGARKEGGGMHTVAGPTVATPDPAVTNRPSRAGEKETSQDRALAAANAMYEEAVALRKEAKTEQEVAEADADIATAKRAVEVSSGQRPGQKVEKMKAEAEDSPQARRLKWSAARAKAEKEAATAALPKDMQDAEDPIDKRNRLANEAEARGEPAPAQDERSLDELTDLPTAQEAADYLAQMGIEPADDAKNMQAVGVPIGSPGKPIAVKHRGQAAVIKRLAHAVAREEGGGSITGETVSFVQNLLSAFHDTLTKDLGVSIRKSGTGVHGRYLTSARVIELMASDTRDVAEVFAHEFGHHLSEFIPAGLRRELNAEFEAARGKFIRKNAWGKEFLANPGRDKYAETTPTQEQREAAYRYVNSDEYIAEQFRELSFEQVYEAKMGAEGSALDRAVNWIARPFRAMLRAIKVKFGYDAARKTWNELKTGNFTEREAPEQEAYRDMLDMTSEDARPLHDIGEKLQGSSNPLIAKFAGNKFGEKLAEMQAAATHLMRMEGKYPVIRKFTGALRAAVDMGHGVTEALQDSLDSYFALKDQDAKDVSEALVHFRMNNTTSGFDKPIAVRDVFGGRRVIKLSKAGVQAVTDVFAGTAQAIDTLIDSAKVQAAKYEAMSQQAAAAGDAKHAGVLNTQAETARELTQMLRDAKAENPSYVPFGRDRGAGGMVVGETRTGEAIAYPVKDTNEGKEVIAKLEAAHPGQKFAHRKGTMFEQPGFGTNAVANVRGLLGEVSKSAGVDQTQLETIMGLLESAALSSKGRGALARGYRVLGAPPVDAAKLAKYHRMVGTYASQLYMAPERQAGLADIPKAQFPKLNAWANRLESDAGSLLSDVASDLRKVIAVQAMWGKPSTAMYNGMTAVTIAPMAVMTIDPKLAASAAKLSLRGMRQLVSHLIRTPTTAFDAAIGRKRAASYVRVAQGIADPAMRKVVMDAGQRGVFGNPNTQTEATHAERGPMSKVFHRAMDAGMAGLGEAEAASRIATFMTGYDMYPTLTKKQLQDFSEQGVYGDRAEFAQRFTEWTNIQSSKIHLPQVVRGSPILQGAYALLPFVYNMTEVQARLLRSVATDPKARSVSRSLGAGLAWSLFGASGATAFGGLLEWLYDMIRQKATGDQLSLQTRQSMGQGIGEMYFFRGLIAGAAQHLLGPEAGGVAKSVTARMGIDLGSSPRVAAASLYESGTRAAGGVANIIGSGTVGERDARASLAILPTSVTGLYDSLGGYGTRDWRGNVVEPMSQMSLADKVGWYTGMYQPPGTVGRRAVAADERRLNEHGIVAVQAMTDRMADALITNDAAGMTSASLEMSEYYARETKAGRGNLLPSPEALRARVKATIDNRRFGKGSVVDLKGMRKGLRGTLAPTLAPIRHE